MRCPLCQKQLEQWKTEKTYRKCPRCKAFVRDKALWLSPEEEKERYYRHENNVEDKAYQNFTAPIHTFITRNFTPSATGLDYGCGSGPVVTHVLAKKGFCIALYDPYFFPKTEVFDKRYDFIILSEVVEHFNHPKESFTFLKTLLKPGGMLVGMTHIHQNHIDISTWYYASDPTHVFLYTKETFNQLAQTFNLTLMRLEEKLFVLMKNASNK